jgi:hypothetical protein
MDPCVHLLTVSAPEGRPRPRVPPSRHLPDRMRAQRRSPTARSGERRAPPTRLRRSFARANVRMSRPSQNTACAAEPRTVGSSVPGGIDGAGDSVCLQAGVHPRHQLVSRSRHVPAAHGPAHQAGAGGPPAWVACARAKCFRVQVDTFPKNDSAAYQHFVRWEGRACLPCAREAHTRRSTARSWVPAWWRCARTLATTCVPFCARRALLAR